MMRISRIHRLPRLLIAISITAVAGIITPHGLWAGPPVLLSNGTPAPSYFTVTPDGTRVVYSNYYNNTGVEPGVYSVPVGGGAVITLSPPDVDQGYLVV